MRGSFGTSGFMYTQRAVGGKAAGSGLIELSTPKVSPAKGEMGTKAATGAVPPSPYSPPAFFLFMYLLTVEGQRGFFLLISVQSMLPTCRTFDLSTPNSLRMLRMDPLTRTREELQPTDTGRAAPRIFASAAEAACSLSHARESSLILGSARCARLVKARVVRMRDRQVTRSCREECAAHVSVRSA